ncbi:MAG: ATP-binding protein [Flavobacterium sp.]|nr:ATP-binding protein [Flavobacterium sp.]
MILKYNSDYLSIKKFNDVELPNFIVLTGLNGAGKSHLLKSLKLGNVVIDNVLKEEIVDFNNITFSLDNEPKISFSKIQSERSQIYQSIEKSIKNINNPHKNKILPIINKIIEKAKKSNVSFYEFSKDDFIEMEFESQYEHYKNYLNHFYQRVKTPAVSSNKKIESEILKLISFCSKPIEDLTREELDNIHIPFNYKNDFLITQLGRIFSDYWQKYELNEYNKFRNDRFSDTYKILSEEDFIIEHGRKPWDLINEILSRFGSLEYKVNNPEGLERGHEYQLNLISIKNPNIIVDFENLSSGERTMMALVSSIYKSMIDKKFPKLLLLDEVDASLHPSMSKIMIEVIQEEFVNKNNIKVILVTHSPSTVALTPENSIYVMNKDGLDRIIKSNNKEALNILTEGFASLTNDETNLKVSYNISKSSDYVLLTEGITDRIILEAAWNKLEKSKPNFDIQDCFDASFLRNIFSRKEIFINYPNKTFVAVFDFDKEGYEAFNSFKDYHVIESNPKMSLLKKSKTYNSYVMLLPVPDNDIQNQVIKSGNQTFEDQAHMPIELLFHEVEKVKEKFIIESQVGGGNIIKFLGDKVNFATKIKEEFIEEDLKNIKPIFETLKNIFK